MNKEPEQNLSYEFCKKKSIFQMDLLLEISFENIKETRSFCTCLHLFTIK
jgi:hypothetical protein